MKKAGQTSSSLHLLQRPRRLRRLALASLTTCALGGAAALPVIIGPAAAAAASPASIKAVGQPYYATSSTTLDVDPATVGDLMVLTVAFTGSAGFTTVPSVSGGGVGSWQQDASLKYGNGAEEIWWGVAGSAGPSTIDVGISGTFKWEELAAQEFTAGPGATWSAGADAHALSASSTVDFPTLSPSSTKELYYGYAFTFGTASAGSTPGFTYAITPSENVIAVNTDVSRVSSATATQDMDGSGAIAGLFAATVNTVPADVPSTGSGITAVGGTSYSSNPADVPVSPVAAGDLLVATVAFNGGSSDTSSIQSVSGGGVVSWQEGARITYKSAFEQLWWGVVSSTGPSTLSVNFTGPEVWAEVSAQEFAAAAGDTWSAGAGGFKLAASSSVVFPTLTPASAGELYFGYAYTEGEALAGSTNGFTYTTTPAGNLICWDTNVSSTVSPRASQNALGSGAVAQLFVASPSGPSVAR